VSLIKSAGEKLLGSEGTGSSNVIITLPGMGGKGGENARTKVDGGAAERNEKNEFAWERNF